MTLFPSADQAVAASLAMLDRIDEASDELGDDGPLRIGIGLHTGPLMLGTIGGQERLATGVVGDAGNTASRIEGLTKQYGHALLVSDATKSALEDGADLTFEEVDRVAPKGKRQELTLYAVLRTTVAASQRQPAQSSRGAAPSSHG